MKFFVMDSEGDFGKQDETERKRPISQGREKEDYDVGLTSFSDEPWGGSKADAILLAKKLCIRWPEYRPYRVLGIEFGDRTYT